MKPHYLNSGQSLCYNSVGDEIPCPSSGQDADFKPGAPWPRPRFRVDSGLVRDRLTGLIWLLDANRPGFPLSWTEALEYTASLANQGLAGCSDWRLPNRNELHSLISFQDKNPALPDGHPFENVFLGWYWTSTSAAINPDFAWYVHMEGGRMFYGHKNSSYLVWPVCGEGNGLLPATGQVSCFDTGGRKIPCIASGQDAELRMGAVWPKPRFIAQGQLVRDRLTGLVWTRDADLAAGPLNWEQALKLAAGLDIPPPAGYGPWRLPTINELNSLVDAGRHSPALHTGHPFAPLAEAYWSSTSSAFESDWCMALYLHKGAVGVGQKKGRHFHAWAVCSPHQR
jgi:hypothetical protein